MSEKKNEESIINKKLSRRSMLKWTAGLAVAGAVGIGVGYGAQELLHPTPPPSTMAEQPGAMAEEKRYVVMSMHGPRFVYVKNGRAFRADTIPVPADAPYPHFKVNGIPFTPPMKSINGPCAMGYRDYVYAANRVMYPMKRVDFTPGPQTAASVANRGKGEYVRITWDEALDILAGEIKRMWSAYGAGAIADASK
jgi:anaerobic selenocysteine-containing dehydrogenase